MDSHFKAVGISIDQSLSARLGTPLTIKYLDLNSGHGVHTSWTFTAARQAVKVIQASLHIMMRDGCLHLEHCLHDIVHCCCIIKGEQPATQAPESILPAHAGHDSYIRAQH